MNLLQAFRHNWYLKTASIIVGLTLWLHVKTDQTYERAVLLPLEIAEPTGRFVVSNEIPQTIQVRISGTGKQLLLGLRRGRVVLKPRVRQPESLTVEITPSDVEGIDPNSGISVTSIDQPRALLLEFDFLETREARVVPRIGVQLRAGYVVVGGIRSDPATVLLGGPQDFIRGITSVFTDSVLLTGISADVDELVTLDLPPDAGVIARPDTVRIRANVQPLLERRFTDIPIRVVNLPRSLRVRVNPVSLTIDISGGERLVNTITGEAFSAEIDYTQVAQSGIFDLPITVSAPEGVSVAKLTPATARVEIQRDAGQPR
jgi:YbbR domain-containing protein